jgi:hypothetical protein
MLRFEKITNFLNSSELDLTSEIFDSYFCNHRISRRHTNVIELSKHSMKNEKIFQDMSDHIKDLLIEKSGYDNLVFRKLWLVKTLSTNCNITKLPYLPHFDKKRFLKGMIYLTKVSESCGPIHFADGKMEEIEKLRRSMPKNYKERKLNVLQNSDLASNMKSISGLPGDLVLFDTNTPHQAGVVKDGFERKVLRFDYEDPSFNTQSLFQGLRKTF